MVSKCEDWHLYPVYVLPAGGRASRKIEIPYAGYETMCKPVIGRHYRNAIRTTQYGFIKMSGLTFILLVLGVWILN